MFFLDLSLNTLKSSCKTVFSLLLFNVVLGFFDEKISSKNYGWKLWQKADKNTLLSCSGTLELKNANAEKHKKSFFQ